jgi:hypothetical protein
VLAASQLAFEPVLAHHPRDPVTTDVDVAAAQFLPGLAGAVDAPAPRSGGLDLEQQLAVGELACRWLRDLRA